MDILLATLVLLGQEYPPVPYPKDKAPEDQVQFDFRLRGWFANIKGDLMLTDDGLSGSDLDFSDDFDLERPESVGSASIRTRLFGGVFLQVDGWAGGFDGQDVTTTGFIFGGSVYPPGTTVEADMKFIVASAVLAKPWTLFDNGTIRFDVEVGIGVRYARLEASVKAKDTPIPFEEMTRVGVALPAPTVRLRAWITDWVSIEAWASGFRLGEIRDVEATMYEGGIEARVHIYRGLYVTGGYHVSFLKIGQEDGTEDLEYEAQNSGFTVGLGFEF